MDCSTPGSSILLEEDMSPGVCSNSCPLSSCPYYLTIWSSASPFSSCLQSFPASKSFAMSQHFSWGGQGIRTSAAAAAAAKSFQSCLTLCDPIDGSPPGSPIPGILQARTLEWVAISFSNAWKWKVKVKLLSRVWLLATPWTAAHQAPPSMGFSRQEYWSGVPLPSPRTSASVLVNSHGWFPLEVTGFGPEPKLYWNPIK